MSQRQEQCMVCGGASPVRLRLRKGRHPGTQAPFEIVECLRCSFQWALPTPTAEELAKFYAASGGYAHYVRAADLKREHFRLKLDELAGLLPSPGSMLDVGCATGFLLEAAQERGWDVTGVELNREFQAVTSRATRERIVYGTLHDAALPGGYRLITLFDVLEHSPQPRADLERCRELLAPDGVVVTQLPCVDSLGCRVFGRAWYHYGPPAHLSYFSSESFRRLAQAVGLRVVDQRWTRKLFTVDYFASQLALEYGGLERVPHVPWVGSRQLRVPMSERLFTLARA